MAQSIKRWSAVNLTKTPPSSAGLKVGVGAAITKDHGIDISDGFYHATSSDDADNFDPSSAIYKMIKARYASGYASQDLYIVRQFDNATALSITGIEPNPIDDFKPISDGSFDVTLNGVQKNITGLDFANVNPTTSGTSTINMTPTKYSNMQQVMNGCIKILVDDVSNDVNALDFTSLDDTKGTSSLTISEDQYKALAKVTDGDITVTADGTDIVLTGLDFSTMDIVPHANSKLILTETQAKALFAIKDGDITIAVDGVDDVLTAVDFSTITEDPTATSPDWAKFATELAEVIQTKSTKSIVCTGEIVTGSTSIEITIYTPEVGPSTSIELKKSTTVAGTDLSIATLLDTNNQTKKDFDLDLFSAEMVAVFMTHPNQTGFQLLAAVDPSLNDLFFNLELKTANGGATASVEWKKSTTITGTDLSVPLMLNIAGQVTTTLDFDKFITDFENIIQTAFGSKIVVKATKVTTTNFSLSIASPTAGIESKIELQKSDLSGIDLSIDDLLGISSQVIQDGTGVASVISYDQIAKIINDAVGSEYIVKYNVLSKHMEMTSIATGTTETASDMQDGATGTPILSLLGWERPTINNGQDTESISTTLQRLKNQGVRWYQQFYDTESGYTEDDIKEMGAWCSTPSDIDGDTQGHMLYFEVSGNIANLDGTAYDDLSKRNYDYVAIYNKQKQAYLSLACGGVMSEIDYGTADANQNMAGRAFNGFIPDDLTDEEWVRLKELKINCYTTYGADQPMFYNGVTLGDGEWVDAVAGSIAFLSDVQVGLFTLLYQSSIPYSESGATLAYQTIVNKINKYKVANVIAGRNITEASKQKLIRVFKKKNAPSDFMNQGYLIYTPDVTTIDPVVIDGREFPAFQLFFTTTGFINKYTTNALELR